MAESTLTLSFADLKARLGRFAGYGAIDATSWSTGIETRLEAFIKDGLRRFYGEREWGFLRPYRTLNTAVDEWVYDLPLSVAYPDGSLYHEAESGYSELYKIDADKIMQLRQRSATSGVPQYYAVRAAVADGTQSQRRQVVMWPTPDAIYPLTYRARIVADALSAEEQYALGSDLHAQTILEACLAAVESGENDAPGIHEAAYQRELDRSIDRDAHAYAPRTLGYNLNRRPVPLSKQWLPPDLTIDTSGAT